MIYCTHWSTKQFKLLIQCSCKFHLMQCLPLRCSSFTVGWISCVCGQYDQSSDGWHLQERSPSVHERHHCIWSWWVIAASSGGNSSAFCSVHSMSVLHTGNFFRDVWNLMRPCSGGWRFLDWTPNEPYLYGGRGSSSNFHSVHVCQQGIYSSPSKRTKYVLSA